MKLRTVPELIGWLLLVALSIGPLLHFPGYHGVHDTLKVSPYWAWQLALVATAFWLKKRQWERPRWLRAVGVIAVMSVCLVAAEYFMDWAAWYK
jgi:hypothetical protein